MLKRLDFHLGRPLPLHFLRRYSKAGEVSELLYFIQVDQDLSYYKIISMNAVLVYCHNRLYRFDYYLVGKPCRNRLQNDRHFLTHLFDISNTCRQQQPLIAAQSAKQTIPV